jgi:hypothetical protein
MLVEHSTRAAFVFVSRHHFHQHSNFPTFPYQKIRSRKTSHFSFDFGEKIEEISMAFHSQKGKIDKSENIFFAQYLVCAEH